MTDPLLAIVAFLSVAIVIIIVAAALRRSQTLARAEHLACLAHDGWTIEDQLPTTRRRDAFAPFAHARAFPREHRGVRALLSLDRVSIIESRHTESSGKHSRTIHILAARCPCPPSWPRLSLTREHLLHKIDSAFGSRDLQLDDPAFNARWRVRCDQEAFAVLLLNPDAQRLIMADDVPGESFWIQSGGLVCVRRERLSHGVALAIRERVLGFLLAAPPELAPYTPDRASDSAR